MSSYTNKKKDASNADTPYVPKEGDIITFGTNKMIGIYKSSFTTSFGADEPTSPIKFFYAHAAFSVSDLKMYYNAGPFFADDSRFEHGIKLASPKEIDTFIAAMHNDDREWDPRCKKIVPYIQKLKKVLNMPWLYPNQSYWTIFFMNDQYEFAPCEEQWWGDDVDYARLRRGLVVGTREEAEELCEKYKLKKWSDPKNPSDPNHEEDYSWVKPGMFVSFDKDCVGIVKKVNVDDDGYHNMDLLCYSFFDPDKNDYIITRRSSNLSMTSIRTATAFERKALLDLMKSYGIRYLEEKNEINMQPWYTDKTKRY